MHNKKNLNFYLGIDYGGTKCDVICTDENLNKISKFTYKAYHYSKYPVIIVTDKLCYYINKSLKYLKFDLNYCKGIVAGIAGARTSKDKKIICNLLSRKLNYKKLIIESDAIIALYGAFGDNNGVVLISGTGSILLCKLNDKIIRIGGWGKILGDGGSGHWIAQEFLKEIVKEYDKKKSAVLLSAFKKKFGINRHNIVSKIYHSNFEIQKITPFILKNAESGNKFCLKIIDSAVNELTDYLKIFLQVYSPKEKLNIVLSGGIIGNKNILSKKLQNKIKQRFLNIFNIINKQNTSVSGAVFLAKKIFGE